MLQKKHLAWETHDVYMWEYKWGLGTQFQTQFSFITVLPIQQEGCSARIV